MDILIESTKGFEKDLDRLSDDERTIAVETINAYAALFSTQKAYAYRKLHRLTLDAELNGYESSLYTLKVSQKLRVILTVDEDPIFNQIIFTLFRVVNLVDVHMTYQAVAGSLYQEIAHHNQQAVQAS
ncbi:hypothetical protein VB780_06205 [Leptolyngbya sp. CCNP1308]|uniref:hypothetical protein n=1 Tax=Leptolyngbya sp. CCNP1308 TaxID=3110255 RepID=UPI002B1FEB93|nr:hypothetical protein [Leptolyngbya sp. CCNP1308]MEA5448155.1 hypothetical protein [Leptolyngbya sp. CCNP1308]